MVNYLFCKLKTHKVFSLFLYTFFLLLSPDTCWSMMDLNVSLTDQKTMIIGARYTQKCYEKYKSNKNFCLVDILEPCSLKHDILNPFSKEYHGVFDSVVFEQLPCFVITEKSINNTLEVLKKEGVLSMNFPLPLMKGHLTDYSAFKPIEVETEKNKITLYKTSFSFIFHDETLKKFEQDFYKEEDSLMILGKLLPYLFNWKSCSPCSISVVPYNHENHFNKNWFKEQIAPNPPFLLFIKKTE